MKTIMNCVPVARQTLAAMAIFALVLSAVQGVFVPQAYAASGAIWTTTGSCGDPQNVNQYQVGQTVYINGSGFDPNVTLGWVIKEPGNGGQTIISGDVTTDANGDLCTFAILLTEAELGGPYQTNVEDTSTKNDNFKVVAATNQNGTLTVVKNLVNAPQGVTPDDFNFTINSTLVTQQFDVTGTNAVPLNLGDGPFTVVEVEANGTGYTTTYSNSLTAEANCTDLDLTTNGATCTITNTYEQTGPTTGTLVVKKVVTDQVVSPGNFSFTVNGGQSQAFGSDGENVITNVTPGNYTILEVADTDYTTAYSNSLNQDLHCTDLAVTAGATTTCTITNTQIPPQKAVLHVVKNLTQDNGGSEVFSDFSFSISGDLSTTSSWSTDTVTYVLDAGTYTVTEAAAPGYTTTYENTVTADADCNALVLGEGDEATCTITNDDIQPLLTVTKRVLNNSGTGQLEVGDFPLFVDQVSVVSGEQNGFDAGDYVVSETNDPGYNATFSGACDENGNVSLVVGDVKECIITNDDLSPTSVLVNFYKEVLNDFGGTALSSDFSFVVDDGNATTAVAHGASLELGTGTYTISEIGPDGYELTGYSDFCLNGTFTVSDNDLGQSFSCTITNTELPPAPGCRLEIVSDDTATVEEKGGVVAKILSFIHPEWTAAIPGASWIWGDDPVVDATVDETQTFVSKFGFVGTVSKATLYVASDNTYEATLNGFDAGSDTDEVNFTALTQDEYDVKTLIGQGNNLLQVAVTNIGIDNRTPAQNPAGALYKLVIEGDPTTDDDCTVPYEEPDPTFTITGYKWKDQNANREFDNDEHRIEDWGIRARSGDEVVATTTDESGYYTLVLGLGDWIIEEEQQSGWVQTYPVTDDGTCQFSFDKGDETTGYTCNFGNQMLDTDLSCDYFTATPNDNVGRGANVTLEWGTSNADIVSIDQEVGVNLEKDGVRVVTPVADIVYTLTASRYLDDSEQQMESVTCQTVVDVDTGGGGGSSAPSCRLFEAERDGDEITLRWETRRGNEVSITANGTEIFSDDEDAVDAGTYTYQSDEAIDFELTVARGSRSRTCDASVGAVGGSSASTPTPTPQVLGEQVSAVPLGAADTGAGGTAINFTVVPTWLALRLRTLRDAI